MRPEQIRLLSRNSSDNLPVSVYWKVGGRRVGILQQLVLLTDMIDGSSTELAIELLGTQTSKIMYGEGPEM